MENIIDVTGGQGGKAFLVVGAKKSALIDCGMAYCAPTLIRNIKQVLHTRVLDYILISHSHYDHIGAIPYLKAAWPTNIVLGSAYAKGILRRPNALRIIRQLSEQAAELYGDGKLPAYDESTLKVDDVVGHGDVLELGGTRVKVIETLGHTQCSLSFIVDEQTLFASESTGYMSKLGTVYPAFITSCTDAIASIQACEKMNPRYIIAPHYGLLSKKDAAEYWKNCHIAVQQTKAFILQLFEQGCNEEQIFIQYEKLFRDEQSRLEQPMNAFRLNTEGMIRTVLREEGCKNKEP